GKRNATCRRFCKLPLPAIPVPARDGNACRSQGGADTCWVFSIIELRKRAPVGQPRPLRMRPNLPKNGRVAPDCLPKPFCSTIHPIGVAYARRYHSVDLPCLFPSCRVVG